MFEKELIMMRKGYINNATFKPPPVLPTVIHVDRLSAVPARAKTTLNGKEQSWSSKVASQGYVTKVDGDSPSFKFISKLRFLNFV
jgi:hypothetical protein